MSIKFLVLGGGGYLVFFWGGGKCRFYFYGHEDFSENYSIFKKKKSHVRKIVRLGVLGPEMAAPILWAPAF